MSKRFLLFLFLMAFQTGARAGEYEDHLSKGNQGVKQRRYENAVKEYEQAAKMKPADPEPRLLLGLTYAQMGKFNKALKATKKASELGPSYGTFYNLGLIYAAQNEPRKAIESFDQALRFSPASAMAEYQKGLVYQSEKEYEKAVKAQKRAIELDPQLSDAYVALGGAYYLLGDKMSASKQAEELQKINRPDLANALERWMEEKEEGSPSHSSETGGEKS